MKKLFNLSIFILLSMILTVPIYGATKKEIIEEMIVYTSNYVDSLPIPLSPADELDFHLWERVPVEQREATPEEITAAKRNILNSFTRGLLKERPEILIQGKERFYSLLEEYIFYDWQDISSGLNTYEFQGHGRDKLEKAFTTYNHAYDDQMKAQDIDLTKTKEQQVMELVAYTRVVFEALKLQYLYDDDYNVPMEEIEAAIESAMTEVEAELNKEPARVLATANWIIKKRLNEKSRLRTNRNEDEPPVEVEAAKYIVKHAINEAKATMENFEQGEPSTWAKESIAKYIEAGRIPTHLQSNYQKPITREEFADLFVSIILADLNKEMEEGYSHYYDDLGFRSVKVESLLQYISTTEYFTDTDKPSVKVANMLGMINGSGNHTFNPTGLITREQAAIMLRNYYQTVGTLNNMADRELDDMDQVSPWAVEGVRFVYKNYMNGIRAYEERYIDGDDQKPVVHQYGHFEPKGKLTREQAMVIIGKAQEPIRTKHMLLIRGYVPITPMHYNSLIEIEGDTVRIKGTGHDSYRYLFNWLMSHPYYKIRTDALRHYPSERFFAMYTMPLGVSKYIMHPMYKVEIIDAILAGEQTYFDYGPFTIEHNKDGYLLTVTKTDNVGIYDGYIYDEELNESYIDIKNYEALDPHDYDFNPYAEPIMGQIIAEVIVPEMNEKEKVAAIREKLSTYGYYWYVKEYWAFMGDHNMQYAYNALVEKFASPSGWYNAYTMIFEKLGLDVEPERGSYYDEQASVIDGWLPVKCDGEWQLISVLPMEYKADMREKDLQKK